MADVVPYVPSQSSDDLEPTGGRKMPIPFYASAGRIYFNNLVIHEGLELHKVTIHYTSDYNSGHIPTDINHYSYVVGDDTFTYLYTHSKENLMLLDEEDRDENAYIISPEGKYVAISYQTIGYILNNYSDTDKIQQYTDNNHDIRISGGVYAPGMTNLSFGVKNAESVTTYPE